MKNEIEELTSLHDTRTQLKVSFEQCENEHTNYEEIKQLIRPIKKRFNQNSINISELRTQILLINNEMNHLNDRLEKLVSENDIVLVNDRLLSGKLNFMFSLQLKFHRKLETLDHLNSTLIDIEQIFSSNIQKDRNGVNLEINNQQFQRKPLRTRSSIRQPSWPRGNGALSTVNTVIRLIFVRRRSHALLTAIVVILPSVNAVDRTSISQNLN